MAPDGTKKKKKFDLADAENSSVYGTNKCDINHIDEVKKTICASEQ